MLPKSGFSRKAQLGYQRSGEEKQLLPFWVVDTNSLVRVKDAINAGSFGSIARNEFFVRTRDHLTGLDVDINLLYPNGADRIDSCVFNNHLWQAASWGYP